MRQFNFDVETFSAIDLGEIGSYHYARHPSTDLRCVSYCLVEDGVRGPIETWLPGDAISAALSAIADDPDTLICAFNINFDGQILEQILVPRYGWPAVPRERWRCAQAAALARALPASLDAAAAALKLEVRKDKKGAAVMRQLAGSAVANREGTQSRQAAGFHRDRGRDGGADQVQQDRPPHSHGDRRPGRAVVPLRATGVARSIR